MMGLRVCLFMQACNPIKCYSAICNIIYTINVPKVRASSQATYALLKMLYLIIQDVIRIPFQPRHNLHHLKLISEMATHCCHLRSYVAALSPCLKRQIDLLIIGRQEMPICGEKSKLRVLPALLHDYLQSLILRWLGKYSGFKP